MSPKVFPGALLIGVLSISCHKNHKDSGPTKADIADKKETNGISQKEKYEYEFILNGCSTQLRSFSSKEAFCKGLQDETLNRGCALSLRQEEFAKRECDGNFVSQNQPESIVGRANRMVSIKCGGFIAINGKRKPIDTVFNWDRRIYQKVVMSSLAEPKDAGEYSLRLYPKEIDQNQIEIPEKMEINGWSIDNMKNQSVSGHLASELIFHHEDKSINNTSVQISCVPQKFGDEPFKVEGYQNNNSEPVEMGCIGSYRQSKDLGPDLLAAHFQLNPREEVKFPVKRYVQNAKGQSREYPIDLSVKTSPGFSHNNFVPSMEIVSGGYDNPPHILGQTIGNHLRLDLFFMVAYHKKINIICAKSSELKEIFQRHSN